jgi:hypothetical protein
LRNEMAKLARCFSTKQLAEASQPVTSIGLREQTHEGLLNVG